MAACPLCNQDVPDDDLERHVNRCLDQQESQPAKRPLRTLGSQKKKPQATKRRQPSLTSALIATKRRSVQSEDDDVTVLSVRETSPGETVVKIEATDAVADAATPQNGNGDASGADSEAKNGPESNREEAKDGFRDSKEHTKTETPTGQSQPHTSHPPTQSTQPTKPSTQASTQPDTPSHPSQPSSIQYQTQNKLAAEREARIPLAHRLRPTTLDEYFGQEKLLGANGTLRRLIRADHMPSFILWGPPGVGKTTLARIVAQMTHHKFIELSGADSTTKKLKEVFAVVDNEFALTKRRTILFLDEIHRYNKAVQDVLLPVLERGKITIIGATTENPSFTLNNALLSRCHVFTLDSITPSAMTKILARAVGYVNRSRREAHQLCPLALTKPALDYLANVSQGDSRIALNLLESINAYFSGPEYGDWNQKGIIKVTDGVLRDDLFASRHFHQKYDRQADGHYDGVSALHKSIRGSNADAAIFYLVKMLAGGEDPMFIARRMIVMASEDIGLADSSCLPFAVATKDALEFIGLPEGEIILAHCAIKLAMARKSTRSYRALRGAQAFLTENPELAALPIPLHLRNAPTRLMKRMGYGADYKYNPNYEQGLVDQEYFDEQIAKEKPKFMDDTHLKHERDPAVDPAEYQKAIDQDQEYQEFKQAQREGVRQQYLSLSEEERATDVDIDEGKVTDTEDDEHYESVRYDDGAVFEETNANEDEKGETEEAE
ncbi:DNA-dependent ATPase Mgs1p [Diutina catenulata]